MLNFKELDLQKIKLWLLILLFQIISFSVGVYSGHTLWPITKPSAVTTNYTTKEELEPKIDTNDSPVDSSGSDCLIKGSKSKIYHLEGGSFYDRTNPQQCFDTEEEAINAGYTKSSR